MEVELRTAVRVQSGRGCAAHLDAVINDSVPWREQLWRSADELDRRKTQRRWTDRTSFLVEREIMVGCYGIRKLHEARRVSDALAACKWEVTRHVLTSARRPDIWARATPWEYYDLPHGTSAMLSITELCNQVIHSYIWMLSATEAEDFDGIYVASDRQRLSGLFFVPVDRFIELFRAVGSEDISYLHLQRDANGDLQYVGILADESESESDLEDDDSPR
jgi:hypothetical protein